MDGHSVVHALHDKQLLNAASNSGNNNGSVYRIFYHPATISVQPSLSLSAGGTVKLSAESSDKAAGTYQATFVPRAAGAYRATVTVTAADGSPVGQRETGWSSEDYSTPRIVVADGPSTNALNWIANFEGDSDTSTAIGIDFFLTTNVDGDSVLVGQGRAFWTGGFEGEWLFGGDTKASYRFVQEWMADAVAVAQVPLPGAQLLGMLGMGLVGFVRRRVNRPCA